MKMLFQMPTARFGHACTAYGRTVGLNPPRSRTTLPPTRSDPLPQNIVDHGHRCSLAYRA